MRWPQLSQGVSGAFNAVGNGWTPNANIYHVRRTQYFHRQAYGASGSTQFRFFNASPSKFISNLPQSGQISTDTAMWLHHIYFAFETGYDITGAADTNGKALVPSGTAPTISPFEVAEFLRKVMQSGLVKLRIQDRTYLDDFGIGRFPQGGGAAINPAVESTASSQVAYAAHTTNGVPHASNMFEFRPAVPVLPGKQIDLTVDFPVEIAPPSNVDVVFGAYLDGILVSPKNL